MSEFDHTIGSRENCSLFLSVSMAAPDRRAALSAVPSLVTVGPRAR